MRQRFAKQINARTKELDSGHLLMIAKPKELDSGHLLMIAKPKELANRLIEIANLI